MAVKSGICVVVGCATFPVTMLLTVIVFCAIAVVRATFAKLSVCEGTQDCEVEKNNYRLPFILQ